MILQYPRLIFKYVYLNTVIDVTVKKRKQHKLERKFTSHCPYRRSFESANWAIFVQSEHDERIIPPKMMKYAKFVTSEHEIITQLQKLDWKLYGRCTHSYRRKTNIFSIPWWVFNISSTMRWCVQFVSITMPAKQKQSQIQRSRGRWIIDSLTTWTKCRKTECICLQRRIIWQKIWAVIMHQSQTEECVVKVVNEDGNENCSQDSLRLERTRCNTPKYVGSQEFGRVKHASGNRE